jgi:hypothetical protein
LILQTNDINKTLLDYCKTYKVLPNNIDFEILEVYTSFKDEENINIFINDKIENFTKEDFLNEDFKIEQIYTIEIQSIKDRSDFDNSIIKIAINKSNTKVFLSIKSGSIFKYHKDFIKDFTNYINKKKVKNKLLLYVFDFVNNENLNDFFEKVQVNQIYEVKEDIMILISEGIEGEKTINDNFIELYKQNIKNENFEYSNRYFLSSVLENEILFEYIKSKNGSPSRDCFGIYKNEPEPKELFKGKFEFSNNFLIKEFEDKIIYKSLINGYVYKNGNKYDILNEINIKKVDFKTTGDINTNLNSDIYINISENNHVNDSVGYGSKIEVQNLNTKGIIGSHSNIHTKNIVVEGMVHKTSIINSEEGKIKILKGKFIGNNVEVEFLDGGYIEADHVIIKQSSGGKVFAKTITIDNVGSNTLLCASEKIIINNIHGNYNTFQIFPLLKYDGDLKELNKKIKNNNDEKIVLLKENKLLIDNLKSNEFIFEKMKEHIKELKSLRKTVPVGLMNRYKIYINALNLIKNYKEKIKIKEDNIEICEEKINDILTSFNSSYILNNSGKWTKDNLISFKIGNPLRELKELSDKTNITEYSIEKDLIEDIYSIHRNNKIEKN